MPHPIRLIGKLIAVLDKKLHTGIKEKDLRNGKLLVIMVCAVTAAACAAVLLIPYFINPWFGTAVEAVLTYYILAAGSLKAESMKVYHALKCGNTEKARRAVSMIVGRDTKTLDDIGITKAAVETVAENTSDGVIAPLIYTAIGGPILGFFYKAVNTMDSMVGYKNERYLYFGRAAALFDDMLNYIPARLSAYLCIFASRFCGSGYDPKEAFRIYKRDCRNHASPNSAQTESVYAGALGIQLAGDASYFGVIHKKPYIGEAKRPAEYEDIKRANRLMYAAAIICEALCLAASVVIMLLTGFAG